LSPSRASRNSWARVDRPLQMVAPITAVYGRPTTYACPHPGTTNAANRRMPRTGIPQRAEPHAKAFTWAEPRSDVRRRRPPARAAPRAARRSSLLPRSSSPSRLVRHQHSYRPTSYGRPPRAVGAFGSRFGPRNHDGLVAVPEDLRLSSRRIFGCRLHCHPRGRLGCGLRLEIPGQSGSRSIADSRVLWDDAGDCRATAPDGLRARSRNLAVRRK
jgi:hypothetical protein